MGIDEIRKQWKKDELKNYGGNIVVTVAQLDPDRSLTIEDEDWPGASYGRFLTVRDKRRRMWPNIKYDIRVTKPFQGEELYRFVEKLIRVSEESEIGLSCKDVMIYPDSLTIGNMHLYPRIEKNISQEELRRKLMKFYRLSKKYFGDNFRINTRDIESKNKIHKIFSDSELKEQGISE